jgi:16S rRNA (adenine1518-N6/adenine1519-N6)-dimethyltransferase
MYALQSIIAEPGEEARARLSVLTQLLMDIEVVEQVPGKAFRPMPKVDATVLKLMPKPRSQYTLSGLSYTNIKQIVDAGFSQRQKKIRSNMMDYLRTQTREKHSRRTLSERVDALFKQMDVDPNLRPSKVSTEEWCRLIGVFMDESDINYLNES